MALHTVSDDVITSAQAAEYFQRADRRVMIGLRAALELLGLPLPDYAKRKPAGPRSQSAKGVAARYAADHGQPIPHQSSHVDALSDHRLSAAVAKALRKHRTTNDQP